MRMDTRELHDQVFDLVKPAIEVLMEHYAKRKHLHVVIMDPKVKPWEKSFKDAILAQFSMGDPTKWEHDYAKIALSKAQQAWRNQQPNLVTQMLAPATLRSGDTFYYGSFEYYGMVVACSGIEPYFDMLISGWLAIAYQQMSQYYLQKHQVAYPKENFLP